MLYISLINDQNDRTVLYPIALAIT